MLENNKCILLYKLSDEELEKLKIANLKIIRVVPEMWDMKVADIINGLQILKYKDNIPEEKVILFNNCETEELYKLIKVVRTVVKDGILATVTPTTKEWTFEFLLKHLIRERDWMFNNREGR